ncbi:hypothetical protein TRFO_13931 [Tritrichomonas foetus]|uniref:Uncharacterized protein n=1 Tax=Tritrichomonas foetus TaxID=1144522 RepID=A0A1J4KWK3_9EUKA|nr:hypothetical protein TRFO_13931 [Tritrichomonas foetus]|eukprot:OHT15615.1 hypothetical protein TRFO_13931 [Tritrichomonas foetus]
MFNLPSGQKELFPYQYYTLELLTKNKGVFKEAGIGEQPQWGNEEYQQIVLLLIYSLMCFFFCFLLLF